MAIRKSDAVWEGDLRSGKGTMRLGSGAYQGAYSYASRFEEAAGTNPEELIGAAHAGCYSMALSGDLTKAGFTAKRIATQAAVTLGKVDGKSRITNIHLSVEAVIPDITKEKFLEISEGTKSNCPVSAALSGVEITLEAKLMK
jgi:osmotically inducible protein OsmC